LIAKSSIIGFPRIGEQRELKKVLESYWSKKTDFAPVEACAKELKTRHWGYQKDSNIDMIASNDFSYYDNMLGMMLTLGAIPKRFSDIQDKTELFFTMARGDSTHLAMEMTKWFNTNYHYIVPELSLSDSYTLDATTIVNQYKEAREQGINTKISLIGPLTFLLLSKRVDNGDTLELFAKILPIYEQLIKEISTLDSEIVVEMHESAFVKNQDTGALQLLKEAYDKLSNTSDNVKIFVTTYFEHSCEATKLLCNTNIYGLGLDFVYGQDNIQSLNDIAKSGKKLIVGIVDGRNIWINDIDKSINQLNEITKTISKDNIIVGTSCSLLHVPFTLKYEDKLDNDIKSWFAYAVEKTKELNLITKIFFNDELNSDEKALKESNKTAIDSRKTSSKIHDEYVKQRVKTTKKQRDGKYEDRIKEQKAFLKYPELATTTIGSFPQTPEVRATRRSFKAGDITLDTYNTEIEKITSECVKYQEDIGLDVLVHGEFERNDMVEYFGEQLKGFTFSKNGWVQSYGSRCVKPPVIFGDVSRPKPMTVKWSKYAQSLSDKPMKGMLTGPVTILNWSFVRDDQTRQATSEQIAVAISDEVNDLQNNGIKMIQVDEAAFKEGYPLRKENIKHYENWAVDSFKICVSEAEKTTQIHTHMCYSDFNNIIATIEAMDADVISIETARSGNKLLKIFKSVGYKQEVGPGVYDIHSPRVPSVEEMVEQIKSLVEVLPKKQLWINPDCGLKTRKWEEVKPSLENMVEAVKIARNS
jgi:5-methyltetrahydropteroyltriglutamate--homocysteine methyltransferase